jgi:hypothetical protein
MEVSQRELCSASFWRDVFKSLETRPGEIGVIALNTPKAIPISNSVKLVTGANTTGDVVQQEEGKNVSSESNSEDNTDS